MTGLSKCDHINTVVTTKYVECLDCGKLMKPWEVPNWFDEFHEKK